MISVLFIIYATVTVAGWILHRSLFSPLFVYGVVWFLSFIILGLNSKDFYELSIDTIFVYVVGAVAFLIGALMALSIKMTESHSIHRRLNLKTKPVVILLIILITGWFEYYRQIDSLTSGTGLFVAFHEARYALVQASLSGDKVLGPIANLEVIAFLAVAICAVEIKNIKGGVYLFVCALIIGAAYVTLGGAKGGILSIAIVSYIIFYFNSSVKDGVQTGLFTFITVAILFALGLYVVNFTYTDFDSSNDLIRSILIAIRNYWVGGIVAFDQVVQSPGNFIAFQDPTRFFIETANSLGANFKLPPVHADYINISNDEDTNVFTIFYSYYLFGGLIGVFALMMIYSFVMTFLFRQARSGDKRYLILYAFLLNGLIFSIVSERFFLSLNGSIKTVIFIWGFYWIINTKLNISKEHKYRRNLNGSFGINQFK